MEKLKNAVLRTIKPDRDEEKRVRSFLGKLHAIADRITKKDIAFCGSIGKSTWLKGDHDIDMFVVFPKTASREELEKMGLGYGKKIAKAIKGKTVIKYAEHPYVQIMAKGFKIDVVPCYRIEKGEKIKSAVDRSPLHLEYIIHTLSPKLMDEVRLLKQFCKGIGVYGSDAKNLGFSGYICELLILNYRSFESVLIASSSWKAPQLIDVERHLGNISIKDAFSDQPLIVIDPVDPKRNAAANLSSENFIKFINSSKAFLRKPDMTYFFPKKPRLLSAKEIRELQNRGTKFVAIQFKKPDVIDDVLYPQLRSAIKRLDNILKHNEFVVIKSFEYVGKDIILVFELEVWSLPDVKKMVGPPIVSQKHSKEFMSKYKKPRVEGTRWVAEKDREFLTASQLLASIIKLKADVMMQKGIPSNIAKGMTKAKIPDFSRLINKDKGFSAFLRKKYF